MGDAFEPGPWTLGKKYKWMCVIAIVEVLIVVVIYFNAPFSSAGVPWESDFDWSLFNYTPVVTVGVVRRGRHLVAGERAQLVHGPAPHDRRDRTPRSGRRRRIRESP